MGLKGWLWVSSSSQLRVSQGSTCVLSTLTVPHMHTVPQGSTCVLSTLTVPQMHTVPQGSTCVLSTLTVSNMHTVPQGSPCALTALRVPQGSSSILSHVWLKGFKTNDTQFQKYCHEK